MEAPARFYMKIYTYLFLQFKLRLFVVIDNHKKGTSLNHVVFKRFLTFIRYYILLFKNVLSSEEVLEVLPGRLNDNLIFTVKPFS